MLIIIMIGALSGGAVSTLGPISGGGSLIHPFDHQHLWDGHASLVWVSRPGI